MANLSAFKTNFTQKKLKKIAQKIVQKDAKKSNYPLVVVVEGKPQSGKTTFINAWLDEWERDRLLLEDFEALDYVIKVCLEGKRDVHVHLQHVEGFIGGEADDRFFQRNFFLAGNKSIFIFEKNFTEYLSPCILKRSIRIQINNESFQESTDLCEEQILEKIKQENQDESNNAETIIRLPENLEVKSEERIFDVKEFEDVYGFNPISGIFETYKEEILSDKTANLEKLQSLNIAERFIRTFNKKPSLIDFSDEKIKKLLSIIEAFPNIETTGKECIIAMLQNISYGLLKEMPTNLLLVGPPGCGKTEFARQFSTVLQENPIIITIGTNGGASKLVGTGPTYKVADSGMLISSLSRACNNHIVRNPVVILDEIEKGVLSGSNNEDDNLEGVFCQILEKKNSKSLFDNYYRVTFDGSKIFYILTANYKDKLPETILSRVQVLNFREYTPEEMIGTVIPNIYKTYRNERNTSMLPEILPEETCEVIEKLCKNQPRNICNYVEQIANLTYSDSDNFCLMILKGEHKEKLLAKITSNSLEDARKIGFKLY